MGSLVAELHVPHQEEPELAIREKYGAYLRHFPDLFLPPHAVLDVVVDDEVQLLVREAVVLG